MRKTECANVENRISAQEGVSWLLCSLKIKGPKSYPPPFLEHCVAHLFRRLDWAAFGNDALLDGKKLCRAAFFAKNSSKCSYAVLCIERPTCHEPSKFRQLICEGWSRSLQELRPGLEQPPPCLIGEIRLKPRLALRRYRVDIGNTHLPPTLVWDVCDCGPFSDTRPAPVTPEIILPRANPEHDSLADQVAQVERLLPEARMSWLEEGIFE